MSGLLRCPFPPCGMQLQAVQLLSGPHGGVLVEHIPSHLVSDTCDGWVGDCPAGLMMWPLAEHEHTLLREVARTAQNLAAAGIAVRQRDAVVGEKITQSPYRVRPRTIFDDRPSGGDIPGVVGFPKLLDDQKRLDAIAERWLG